MNPKSLNAWYRETLLALKPDDTETKHLMALHARASFLLFKVTEQRRQAEAGNQIKQDRKDSRETELEALLWALRKLAPNFPQD